MAKVLGSNIPKDLMHYAWLIYIGEMLRGQAIAGCNSGSGERRWIEDPTTTDNDNLEKSYR